MGHIKTDVGAPMRLCKSRIQRAFEPAASAQELDNGHQTETLFAGFTSALAHGQPRFCLAPRINSRGLRAANRLQVHMANCLVRSPSFMSSLLQIGKVPEGSGYSPVTPHIG